MVAEQNFNRCSLEIVSGLTYSQKLQIVVIGGNKYLGIVRLLDTFSIKPHIFGYLAFLQGQFYTEFYRIIQDHLPQNSTKHTEMEIFPFTVDGEIILSSTKFSCNSLKNKLPLFHCFCFYSQLSS